jgi:hypothetical protein
MGLACDSQSIPRMARASQMFRKRPVGKPKTRWTDAVKEYSYQVLKRGNWEVKAQDRGERRSRVEKARFGL